MKTVLSILGIIAVGLGAAAVAIALGDRQLFVQPPDAVAENFTREIAERRYDIALGALAEPLKALGADGLRDKVRRLEEMGETNSVEAETLWMTEDRAAARATIDAERGTAVVEVRLGRQHGLWVIDELPAEIPVALTPPAPEAARR